LNHTEILKSDEVRKVFWDIIFLADSSFPGRNPAHPIKDEAVTKDSISPPDSDKIQMALNFWMPGMVHNKEISLAK
jgi:hypothetical protein